MSDNTTPTAAPTTALTTALTLRDRLASGALTCETVTGACLSQIQAREPQVQAWAWLDSDHALKLAQRLDTERRAGRAVGALHGLPVGIKDIIDTAGIPTANGTVIDEARVPTDDACVVTRLKEAGAFVMGKTVTAELAFMQPGKTRHPIDTSRSPGGSSSGSAAAVATGMVPLAIGTQTGGSVIRPAAFCGVVGFKPSFGAIARTGILPQSPSLDTVGVFGRCVEDVALLADVLCGHDPGDRHSRLQAPPRLLRTAQHEPPMKPVFAFVRTPFWARAEALMQQSLAELVTVLGEACFEADLPSNFADALRVRQRINQAEMAKNYFAYRRRGEACLSTVIRQFMDAGDAVLARDYLTALDWPGVLNAGLDEIFERCDAVITPAAPGPAPAMDTTGDSVFNGLWTLCGTPAITLPLFESEEGMPMGVQLVGRLGDDARLLRTARWLEAHVAGLQ